MSQSKEITRESRRNGGHRSVLSRTSRHDALSARLRVLLEARARLVAQLELIDVDLDRVRAEAVCGFSRTGEACDREGRDEASFEVTARDFVRGAVDPPDELDRDDVEYCIGKVIVALRRNGDRLAGASLVVRYHVGTGRVLSIVLRRADDARGEREVYRRSAPELSASG